QCGIELHLPQLIDSIHQVHSPLIAPYLERNRKEICANCTFLHSSICPCPMDYLSVLLVEAVEEVDRRRARRNTSRPTDDNTAIEEGKPGTVYDCFDAAVGSWTGCDWPTEFGDAGLNLENVSAADARTRAESLCGSEATEWHAAANWLG